MAMKLASAVSIVAASFLWAPPAPANEVIPNSGLWWIQAEPGSGIAIDRQGLTIVVTIFSYDEDGSPIWLIGSAPISDNRVSIRPSITTAGSCFNCPYVPADVVDSAYTVEIEFLTSDFARLRFNDGDAKIIRSFLYEYELFAAGSFPELGRLVLPDLTGRWVFASENGDIKEAYDFECCVFLDPPGPQGALGILAVTTDGNVESLRCVFDDPNTMAPYCTLAATDAQTPYSLAEKILTFFVGDVGPERITAYSGAALPADSPSVRGPELIYGFRLPPESD